MESILTSIKKLLGPGEDYDHFDADIILHINSTFSVLNQLGVGPSEGFRITDSTEIWTDYIPDDPVLLEMVKSYMYLKVKLLFDPPTSSAVLASMERQADTLEWRLNKEAEFR